MEPSHGEAKKTESSSEDRYTLAGTIGERRA
jgi:hypothetical protein